MLGMSISREAVSTRILHEVLTSEVTSLAFDLLDEAELSRLDTALLSTNVIT